MKIYTPTDDQVDNAITEIRYDLLHGERIKYKGEEKWHLQFKDQAGVYTVFKDDKPIYIGETANLRKRMRELNKTYNHPLKKKLGFELDTKAKLETSKFGEATEKMLEEYYINHISVSQVVVTLGRSEIEAGIINSYKEG